MTPDTFADIALATVPRVLGLCDRRPNSPTEGCCDRHYWHYRMIDFANARFQEAGWLIAAAYRWPGSRFHDKVPMMEWCRAAWRFWLARRNPDGSVMEAYPRERSFCATSFSAAAFVETMVMTGAVADDLVAARNTLIWLGHARNPEVANQMAASLHAMTGYVRLTGDTEVARLARKRRDELLALARPDGGFAEYGGLDLGYQSITMSTIARIIALSGGDDDLFEVLRRGETLLDRGIGEDGRIDPARNSRGTQYIYPHSLAFLRSPVLNRLETGLANGAVLNPAWMDDRYCIAMATDYLIAAMERHQC